MPPNVYIVILNYNGWGDTIECLESLMRSTYRNFQVIVVDNNSPDMSMGRIISWAESRLDVWVRADSPLRRLTFPPVARPADFRFFSRHEFELAACSLPAGPGLFLVQSGENKGFAAGNNVALRAISKADPDAYVWLLNPDMTVEADTLARLVDFATSCGKGAICGTHIKDYKRPSRTLFYGGAKVNPYTGTITFINAPGQVKDLDYISGGSLFTCAVNFKNLGMLPEEYFLYWEETDWCTNAMRKGLRLEVCSEAVCYDKVSTSIGTGYISEYYYTLNSIRFFRKYRARQLKYIMFANILRLAKRAFKLKFTNARAIMDALAAGLRG